MKKDTEDFAPLLPHTRQEWGKCPYCGGKQIAEILLGAGWKPDRAHLCLKCRREFYNHLLVIERCLENHENA